MNDFQKSNNVFANSHTQHPYITFGGNLTGGLLTYYMASSVAGHIPGLAQRIGGWSERLSTFPILRRIGQDHLSNIIGATIVDTGAFTVPKAIIDIYNGESSETVFRNAGVDIGRNVLFNIFGEAVSGAVGRVVQRFKTSYGKSTLNSLKNTENFTDSAIEHIFEGQVNARGKAVGYHYEGIEGTSGNVIPGTESSNNNFGVYKAKVEVNGIPKTANGGFSTFYSKNLSPQQVVDAINEAYSNCELKLGTRNTYQGVANNGMKIDMFLDQNGKIISAFPEE